MIYNHHVNLRIEFLAIYEIWTNQVSTLNRKNKYMGMETKTEAETKNE